MLQRRGSYDPQVTEYILPCFLTMDSSIPLPTQLENLTSAPGFLQVPGSSVLTGALAFHFLSLSPASLRRGQCRCGCQKLLLDVPGPRSTKDTYLGVSQSQRKVWGNEWCLPSTTWKLSFRYTWPNKSSGYSYCWLFPKADHSWPCCWKVFLWLSLLFLLLPTPNFWGTSLVISLFYCPSTFKAYYQAVFLKKTESPKWHFPASYKNNIFSPFFMEWELHRREDLDEFTGNLKNQDSEGESKNTTIWEQLDFASLSSWHCATGVPAFLRMKVQLPVSAVSFRERWPSSLQNDDIAQKMREDGLALISSPLSGVLSSFLSYVGHSSGEQLLLHYK